MVNSETQENGEIQERLGASSEAGGSKKKKWPSQAQRRDEARAISRRILESVKLSDAKSRDFLLYRFELPLIWYGEHAPKLGRRHATIAIAVIGAGLLISGLSAVAKGQDAGFGEFVAWVVIFLGVVVGLGTGFSQITKVSQKSVAYANAQDELRREGWGLVHRRGKYKKMTNRDAFGAFVDVVLALEARTRAVDKPEDHPPHD